MNEFTINIWGEKMMRSLLILLLLVSNVLFAEEVSQAQGAESSSRQHVASFMLHMDDFSMAKYKKYKKYRGNLFLWLDKYEQNKENKSFRKSFKKNVKFMLKNFKSYLLAEIKSDDKEMNNQTLLKKFYKKMLDEKVIQAVKETEGVHAAVQGSTEDSSVGQVFGDREEFSAQLDQGYSSSEDEGTVEGSAGSEI